MKSLAEIREKSAMQRMHDSIVFMAFQEFYLVKIAIFHPLHNLDALVTHILGLSAVVEPCLEDGNRYHIFHTFDDAVNKNFRILLFAL
jgi:hypothetical protein